MNADEFKEMSIDDARSKVVKSGLKGLTKNPGEFYYDFFSWGLWRPDFKEKLSILVEHGLDLNQPICERWDEKITPIFQVLSSSGREVASAIKALVEFGADINLPNKDGRTAIMVASTGKYSGDLSKPSVVKALIKAGADLSIQDSKGNLVTDLADEKALPALVAAGASFNTRKSHALWTAVWGKDLKLTQDLLQKGLKKNLNSWELQVRHPFLEIIAQTCPTLFQKGFSLEDTKAKPAEKKAVKAFNNLLDMCSAKPKSNSSLAADEDELPTSLRIGAWPPQKPEPTAPISVKALSAPTPEFHFPPDLQSACVQMCEITSDKRSADKKRSDFSKFISEIDKTLKDIENTDWDAETKKFIENPISRVLKESSSSRIWKLNQLLRHHQEVAFNTYYAGEPHRGYDWRKGPLMINIGMGFTNTFNHFVEIKTSINTVGTTDLCVWSNDEELLKNREFISYAVKLENGLLFTSHVNKEINFHDIGIFDSRDIQKYLELFEFVKIKGLWGSAEKIHYCTLAYRIGPSASESLQRIARGGDEHALGCLSHLNAEPLASFMAETLSQPGRAKHVQAWFRLFPETAVTGLLKCSFGSDLNERCNAQQALRWLAKNGSRELIIDCALKFGEEAQAVAIEFLGYDSRADYLPKKMPKLPSYFIASAHPAPTLKSSGEALPPHAIETLVRMMLVPTCHLQNSALQDVIEACDRHSLAEFALSTFNMWSRNGSKKDGIGFLYALAYLGDNRAAALLGKSYRNAPPTAATPVIDVLAAIGSNTAIAGLQAIARSSSNDKSRKIAQEVLDDVARDRGLTPTMLEDLSVPDLGLDSNGQMSLDFGPRKFVVTINANLEAILTDSDGNAQKTLPKPVKADNAHKAKTATAQWKEFKAAFKEQAADQKKRFEQAMLTGRKWDGAAFKEIVAVHPLLSKMVSTLVWATVKGKKLDTAFRIDTDGRYVTADGAELTLDNEARVTLPHPLLLGDKVQTWLQIFAENKLTQPFPQLARKWFAEGAETERLIRARDGTKVPLGSLRGLKAKGWEFEEGGAGMVWSVYKFDEGARASIDVEPGWSLSGFDYEDFGGDQTVKLDVSGSDPIAYSELVRDFLSLPIATGEEP